MSKSDNTVYKTERLLKSKALAGYQQDFARVILTKPFYTLGGWSLLLPTGFHVSRGTLDHIYRIIVSTTWLLHFIAELSNSLHLR